MGMIKTPIHTPDFNYIINYGYDGDLIEYIGWAAPGSGDGEEKWVIIKNAYSGTKIISVRKAHTDVNTDDPYAQNKEWDERDSYDYR